MRFCWLAAPLLALVACQPPEEAESAEGEDADYAAQVEALCRAEVSSGAIAAFPYGAKGEVMQRWLDTNLTHPKAHALYFETVLQSPVHHQKRVLEEAAAEAGVTPCPLASYLDFLAKMPIEAASDDDCVTACTRRNAPIAPDAASACATGCGQ